MSDNLKYCLKELKRELLVVNALSAYLDEAASEEREFDMTNSPVFMSFLCERMELISEKFALLENLIETYEI